MGLWHNFMEYLAEHPVSALAAFVFLVLALVGVVTIWYGVGLQSVSADTWAAVGMVLAVGYVLIAWLRTKQKGGR